ncbi:uncharacterized protein I206_105830 [Kwoniella pini CBS 10737]|uniref:Uncharacterized protein n=1 Tax=Kwoniella pini CBS 10737 TaxID=1296096 RepID=A0A1B9I096_9TREE|nr:uncharacterized protein I206_04650 [Kwoniella pini CBS 10737]OCF48963.1 hypothetical protein I206_04650 [Kwoniella pini CBS 10737]
MMINSSKVNYNIAIFILSFLVQGISSQYIPIPIHDKTNKIRSDENDNYSNSNSKDLRLLSYDDFCLYGLNIENQNKGLKISDELNNVLSYCSKTGHNIQLIPDGTLKGVTYVKTSSWVQVSGSGDFTKIGISPNDPGGQFDSSKHSPEGSKLITSQGGDPAQNWVTIISPETFCVRACFGDPATCPTQYDSLGCYFLTSNGVGWDDVWQDCEADEGDPPGVINGQTYIPGNGPIPTPSIPAVSNCQPGSSISNGQTAAADSGSNSSDKNDSSTGSNAEQGSTTWLPVQTCLPCTATAGSFPSSSPSGDSDSSSSSVPREGGAQGGGEPSQASSAASSALGSNNPSTISSGSSTSALKSGSAGATALGGASSVTSQEKGGTEQVGVTKLSPSTTTNNNGDSSPTAAPSQGGDLSARDDDQWWNLKRQEEGETITSGDQCCFTTWTPSVIGGTGAKETGTSTKGSNTNKSSGVTTSGSKSGLAPGATSTNPAKVSGNKNGTVSGNGTNSNGTNSSSNALLAMKIWIAGGKIDKLVGVLVGAILGLTLAGMALV